MRARILLDPEDDPQAIDWPLVVEVVEVTTADGETLDIAGWAVPGAVVARKHLGREPEGRPLLAYVRRPREAAGDNSEPTGGSA